jgi:hypothetical protein
LLGYYFGADCRAASSSNLCSVFSSIWLGVVLGNYVNMTVGVIVMLSCWPFATRMARGKSFRDFRKVLLPHGTGA